MPGEPNELRLTKRSEEDAAVDRRDRNLVRGLLAGDADCLSKLIAHYDALVRYTVFRACKTECRRDPTFLDARASEVWSGFVWSIRRGGRGPEGTLKSYLTRIARNKVTDYLRSAAREVTAAATGGESETGLDAPAAPEGDPLATLIDFERVGALRDCMSQLPESDRKLFQELDLITHGQWSKAADRLGMAESTLRSRWAKALDRLRRCLEKKLAENL